MLDAVRQEGVWLCSCRGLYSNRFHSSQSGSLHNDELRLQLVKAQTTSERQANHSIKLTANGRLNVIATWLVRLSTQPLSFQQYGRRYNVILRRSVYTTPQMEREEGTGGSPDVRQAWQGKFRAKKQKMASSLRHEVARAQPHPSLHRHLTQVYRLSFCPIAFVRY